MDDNCKRLSYMDFLSAFDSKAERKCEPPLASPDAVRQIESLDNLSPDVALARMRELVTATAPNLYKVKLTITFLHQQSLLQLMASLWLVVFSRLSQPSIRAVLGPSELWSFVRCWRVFALAHQTNSTDTSCPSWSWTVRTALLTGRTSSASFSRRSQWWEEQLPISFFSDNKTDIFVMIAT